MVTLNDIDDLRSGDAADGAADVEHFRSEQERLHMAYQRLTKRADGLRIRACYLLTHPMKSDPQWSVTRATEIAREAEVVDEEARAVAKELREWARR